MATCVVSCTITRVISKYFLVTRGKSDSCADQRLPWPHCSHLHVHVLASSFTSHPGAVTGQAHLLDDVIDLLKLGIDMKQRTLGYSLGTNSKLWDVLYPAQEPETSEEPPAGLQR